MNSSQRQKLKKAAHALNPVVYIGQQGVSEQVIIKTENELSAHELIKIKFTEFKAEKDELAELLAKETGSEMVEIIGHTAVLFRQHPDPELRKIKY